MPSWFDEAPLGCSDATAMTRRCSALKPMRVPRVGDALITGIETGNATTSAISVVSRFGRILDNGDTRLDIIADTPPAAQLTISAPLGIGADPKLVALLEMLEPYGVRELVQSGMVAVARGSRSLTDRKADRGRPASEAR